MKMKKIVSLVLSSALLLSGVAIYQPTIASAKSKTKKVSLNVGKTKSINYSIKYSPSADSDGIETWTVFNASKISLIKNTNKKIASATFKKEPGGGVVKIKAKKAGTTTMTIKFTGKDTKYKMQKKVKTSSTYSVTRKIKITVKKSKVPNIKGIKDLKLSFSDLDDSDFEFESGFYEACDFYDVSDPSGIVSNITASSSDPSILDTDLDQLDNTITLYFITKDKPVIGSTVTVTVVLHTSIAVNGKKKFPISFKVTIVDDEDE